MPPAEAPVHSPPRRPWAAITRPPRATRHKALRVSLVTTVAFLFNLHVLGEPQAALFGALGPLGLLATADFGGPARVRLRAYLVTLALAAVVVAIGTLLSERTIAASVAMLVIAFVASFGAVAGRNVAGGATAIILFYVVACAIPVPADELVNRLTGLLIAGGLSVAAGMLLWPDHPGRDFRARLGEAALALADLTRRLSAHEPLGEAAREARARLAAVRPYAGAAIDRPAGTAAADAAQVVLVRALDRIEALLARLGAVPLRTAVDRDAALEAAAAPLLETLADSLARCGTALTGSGPPPAAAPVLAAREAHREAAIPALCGVLARGTDGERFRALTEVAYARRVLATATLVAVAHARVALGVDSHLDHAALPAQIAPLSRGRRWYLRVRNNLSLDSVLLRNSLRLALALAAARLLVGLLDLSHGFWVIFATLSTLRSSVVHTGTSALLAVGGTLLGFAVAAALLALTGDAELALTLLLPVGAFLAVYGGGASLALGQAGFTFFVLVLFNLLQASGWQLGLVRVENVAIGVAVGLAIGIAAWPRGAEGQLGRAIARVLETGGAFARDTAGWLFTSGGADADRRLRHQAIAAARRADDVFAAWIGEGGGREGRLADWSSLLLQAHGLWYSAELMGDFPRVREPRGCPHLAEALELRAQHTQARADALAVALRNRDAEPFAGDAPLPSRTPGTECVRSMKGSDDQPELAATVRIFVMRAWLVELGDELATAGPLAARVARG